MRVTTLLGSLGLCLMVLAACSLPRGAALQNEIVKEAESDTLPFALYPVTRNILSTVARWPATGGVRSYSWLRHQHTRSGYIIAPGDLVNLVIWDAEDNSLLTQQGQKMIEMKDVQLSPNGTIFVPYINMINLAGITPDAARAKVQRQMEAIIPSAQVQLTAVPGQRNSVELVGGVGKPDIYPLSGEGLTVLGLISRGGGVTKDLRNPQVRLLRGHSTYGISVSRLFENPSFDASLRGGDKVIVREDGRYFRALGAAGSEQLVYFEKDKISALDAMAIIGGVADSRADPEGILVLREYNANAVRPGGPDHQRVIFTIDLTTSDGLFSAARLMINPGDTVLVTESPITSAQTILGLIGSIFGVASTVSNAAN